MEILNISAGCFGTSLTHSTYDGELLTSESMTGSLELALGYAYDDDFNLTGFTYAGDTQNYVYDDDGLLTSAGSFTISRNADNGLPEQVANGTLVIDRTFNGYGELAGQDMQIGMDGVLSWNLIRDDNGRIIQKIETIDGATTTYAYTYDAVGRLLTAHRNGVLVEEYGYAINGTRIYEMNALRGLTGRAFAYSDEDHLLSVGDTTYQYDVDGFLTTKTQGTDVTVYDYSSRGELLRVDLPDGRVIEYVHDPLGRRIAKKIDGTTVEKYLWQGLTRLLAVYDSSANLLMRFEYADDRMPIAVTKDGATYYLGYDQIGSLRTVVDAAGTVIKEIKYDAFGNVIADSAPTFDLPFGFAGGLYDNDIGLVRFGYRDCRVSRYLGLAFHVSWDRSCNNW